MTEFKPMYLIHSDELDKKNLVLVKQHPLIVENDISIRPIKVSNLSGLHVNGNLNHALVWVKHTEFQAVLTAAFNKTIALSFLPYPNELRPVFFDHLGLPNKFDDCLALVLETERVPVDLIRCNGEFISRGIGLLNQTALAELIEAGNTRNLFKKTKFYCQRLIHAFNLQPIAIEIETAKGKSVKTAIIGLYLLDLAKRNPFAKLFGESASLKDGRLSFVFFAPQSILSYIQSTSITIPQASAQLPRQLGFVRSVSLRITAKQDIDFWIEHKPVSTRELLLETVPAALKITVGDSFRSLNSQSGDKENFNVENLPQGEARLKYFSKTLPFFPHALESDFKDLFLALKENARTTSTYILLMVLSSMLATLGLFLSSPSVVIGAMVLAPLMSPIISLSMGLLRSEKFLTRESIVSLLSGIGIALAISSAMAALLPFKDATPEIEARLHPSTLDLLVAVFSGIAGAMAQARESIAKSLPGVAIAVALVPPLCVAGIGIGWLESDIFLGAMLLFLTNLIGITMAALISFMVIGFAPFTRARKGILLSSLLLALISVPLFYSFQTMEHIADIKTQLAGRTYQINGHRLELRNIKVNTLRPLNLNADLLTNTMPDESVFTRLEDDLHAELGQPARFNFALHFVRETVAVDENGQ